LLIIELFIPPLIVRVRRLVLSTLETMVLIDNNNLSGTKAKLSNNSTEVCNQKTCDSPLNNLQM